MNDNVNKEEERFFHFEPCEWIIVNGFYKFYIKKKICTLDASVLDFSSRKTDIFVPFSLLIIKYLLNTHCAPRKISET